MIKNIFHNYSISSNKGMQIDLLLYAELESPNSNNTFTFTNYMNYEYLLITTCYGSQINTTMITTEYYNSQTYIEIVVGGGTDVTMNQIYKISESTIELSSYNRKYWIYGLK